MSVSSAGTAAVPITCAAPSGSCNGTLALTARQGSAARVAKALGNLLGTTHFSIRAGKTQVVAVHLNGKAQKLLRKRGRLRAKEIIKLGAHVVSSQGLVLVAASNRRG